MFRDFTHFRENSSTRPRPPHATLSEFTKHTDIDAKHSKHTKQSELLIASLNCLRLCRLVLATARCPVHTITAVCTTSGDINSTSPEWRPSARSGEPTPPAFKIKMTAKGSSEHVGTFLKATRHTPNNCAVLNPTNSHCYPTNTAVRLVVYTTGSGTSTRTSCVTIFTSTHKRFCNTFPS